MKLIDIYLKEGFNERTIHFSKNVNIIHSKQNSSGKTTLLRFILYALGYQIPSTRKISFSQCDVDITIQDSKDNLKKITRARNSIEFNENGKIDTFILPGDEYKVHSIIFECSNNNILNNILGAYYLDQEKGWTLLNRGTVIGKIHFNIEELIYGLGDKDYEGIQRKLEKLEDKIEKYNNIHSISLYRDKVMQETGSLPVENYQEITMAKLDALRVQEDELEDELKRINKSLQHNNKIKRFINDMKLMIQDENGKKIHVTDKNIVGLNDSIQFLISRKNYVILELKDVLKEIKKFNTINIKENQQLEFFDDKSVIKTLNRSLANIPLDSISIDTQLKKLTKEKKKLKKESTDSLSANYYTSMIAKTFLNYAKQLDVATDNMSESYIFTSNLRELSGAVLHKLAFAFRLAYIKAIEKYTGQQYPIILDSPYGKEVDKKNVDKMMDILKRDFSDHQIIIASIYKYDFPNANIIEIKDRLIM